MYLHPTCSTACMMQEWRISHIHSLSRNDLSQQAVSCPLSTLASARSWCVCVWFSVDSQPHLSILKGSHEVRRDRSAQAFFGITNHRFPRTPSYTIPRGLTIYCFRNGTSSHANVHIEWISFIFFHQLFCFFHSNFSAMSCIAIVRNCFL